MSSSGSSNVYLRGVVRQQDSPLLQETTIGAKNSLGGNNLIQPATYDGDLQLALCVVAEGEFGAIGTHPFNE